MTGGIYTRGSVLTYHIPVHKWGWCHRHLVPLPNPLIRISHHRWTLHNNDVFDHTLHQPQSILLHCSCTTILIRQDRIFYTHSLLIPSDQIAAFPSRLDRTTKLTIFKSFYQYAYIYLLFYSFSSWVSQPNRTIQIQLANSWKWWCYYYQYCVRWLLCV